jgi:predicted PhzF superfamily epimerase YddE/YHI9
MVRVDVLKVFVGPGGEGGNLLGVVLRGAGFPDPNRRQALAAHLNFSETVFVDDLVTAALRIFTPARELPFAGHPLVGTSWLLRRSGTRLAELRPPAGIVPTWADGDITWIRGQAAWVPSMEMREYGSPGEVDALTGPPPGSGNHYAWSWVDRAAGHVRARFFAPEMGIAEDEATGSAAVRVTVTLGRGLTIRQGLGSELLTRVGPAGTAEVGGRVSFIETRRIEPAVVGPPLT